MGAILVLLKLNTNQQLKPITMKNEIPYTIAELTKACKDITNLDSHGNAYAYINGDMIGFKPERPIKTRKEIEQLLSDYQKARSNNFNDLEAITKQMHLGKSKNLSNDRYAKKIYKDAIKESETAILVLNMVLNKI